MAANTLPAALQMYFAWYAFTRMWFGEQVAHQMVVRPLLQMQGRA